MTEKAWLENFWGWGGNPPELRVALPPTELYPEETRLHGLVLPPYIATWQRGDKIEIDLWEGRGCRVGLDHETEDASQCIYADSDNLPDEWKEPVAKAIAEIQEKYPRSRLVYRPELDKEAND